MSLDQRARHLGELGVPLDLVLGRTADDERGPRLVDEDRVDLVDDGEVVAALDAVVDRVGHVVAQVVEAELVVGAVGDVAGVGLATLGGTHRRQDHAGGQAEEVVHAAHLLGLELGEVVVDRDHVHALAGERVEVGGQHGDERLALTGLHLGDVAEVEGRRAHDLHVEGPHARARACWPPGRWRRPPASGRRGSRPWRAARGTRRSSPRSSSSVILTKSSSMALTALDDRTRARGGSCPRRCGGACR